MTLVLKILSGVFLVVVVAAIVGFLIWKFGAAGKKHLSSSGGGGAPPPTSDDAPPDACPPGYVGYPNCRIDPCHNVTCSGHGTCDAGECTCDAGYAGPWCDRCASTYTGYPACAPDPCQNKMACNNHGECSHGRCTCHPGFAGTACDRCADGYSGYPNCTKNETATTCAHLFGEALKQNLPSTLYRFPGSACTYDAAGALTWKEAGPQCCVARHKTADHDAHYTGRENHFPWLHGAVNRYYIMARDLRKTCCDSRDMDEFTGQRCPTYTC